MPDFKHFTIDNTPITFDWLGAACMSHDKILLIKALRVVSDLGLLDAKKGVETYCMSANGDFDIENTMSYFAKWIGPFESPEEQSKRLAAKQDMKESKAILKGIECIVSNWQTLGFMDKYQAASLVIENLKMRSIGAIGGCFITTDNTTH